MPLAWIRKRILHRADTPDDLSKPTTAKQGPDNGCLSYTTPPGIISEQMERSDYQGALEVLQDDQYSEQLVPEPESAHWQISCLIELGRFEDASHVAESAIDRYPDNADLYLAHASVLAQEGRFGESEEALSMALYYAPASTRLLNMLGDLKQQQRDIDGAIEHYSKSLDYELSIGTVAKLANAFYEATRFQEAEGIIRQGLDKFPENPNLLGTLGRVLMMTDRYEAAIEIQKKLAELPLVDIQLYKDLTYVHYCLGELEQAQYYLKRILSIEPANYDARYYLGLIQLAEGNFAQAWDNYRWRLISSIKHGRHYAFPEWDGTPSPDTTLMIFAEQGLGDQIMFSGCVPDVLEQNQRVVLECDERLAALFARSFPEANVVPWAKNKNASWIRDVGTIDYQIAMGDLPRFYRRSKDAFPDHRGYLKADPAKVAAWRDRLDALGGSRSIGISWRGGTVKTRQGIRSITPEAWRPLLSLRDTNFVSLQYGDVQDDLNEFSEAHGVDVHHWQEAIDDYDETAALVSALDGVVTVCTAIAHLTGALGQIGWVATPVIPEWRYMTGGRRWPWYPQVSLIRQGTLGDWRDVMATIAEQVSEHCSTSSGRSKATIHGNK